MGPKNVCSYADLAMGEVDILAKEEGSIKPNLWFGTGIIYSMCGLKARKNY